MKKEGKRKGEEWSTDGKRMWKERGRRKDKREEITTETPKNGRN